MALSQILIFSVFAILVTWLVPAKWRGWVILVSSLLAVYWLQPALSIRNLDFWLPTFSIGLTLLTWAVTQKRGYSSLINNRWDITIILSIILILGLTRYVQPLCCLTPTRPPQLLPVLLGIGAILGIVGLAMLIPKREIFVSICIIFFLVLFLIIKSEPLARNASAVLRSLNGQDPTLASPVDIRWLGFSFLAFRLLHVLRDHQAGRVPEFSLHEFVSYTMFFPAYPAGPIDRSQRFILQDFRQLQKLTYNALLPGVWRIVIGVFKKFVLADTLGLIALSAVNYNQINSPLWAWTLLYVFSLQIYLDFSAYTDIAIGLGKLFGIHLPENFNAPYLKTNLTAFWNSWHITLASWFRAYLFNPFIRTLRQNRPKLPAWLFILSGQLLTMVLIGIWHGLTWNFAIWGLWHAVGLFIHNRWTEWVRPRFPDHEGSTLGKAAKPLGWFLTFNYVSLGWVWFALPSLTASLTVLRKLFSL